MDIRLRFQRGDWLVIAAVLVLAACVAALFWPGGNAESAMLQIYRNGKLMQEISLSKDQTLQVDGDYHNTVSIQNGRAAITRSDCPGEDCVHSGWISASGRSIVCLPNRVELRIVGVQDVDFAVR